eukprot:12894113-Prorocentrum_lima.AAC.1
MRAKAYACLAKPPADAGAEPVQISAPGSQPLSSALWPHAGTSLARPPRTSMRRTTSQREPQPEKEDEEEAAGE